MDNFIYDYFVSPIWDRTGYNIVNTLVYAAIAIVAVYVIGRILKGRVRMDEAFVKGVLCFVLFGSTMRVVTDSIDNGVFKPVTPVHQWVLESHLLDYGYFTVTPGIYVVTAALLLASLAILHRLGKPQWLGYVGLALWLPNFLLLVPFMKYAAYAVPVLLLAAIPAYLAYRWLKDRVLALIVAGQALDGAATFFVIDIFSKIVNISYFEQHVISSAIGQMFGSFFPFYLIKVGIASAAAYILSKEPEEMEASFLSWRFAMDRYYLALVIIIMGFAPGIRDLLRMVVGA